MPEQTTPKTRTVTLTGRPPVRIREDEWPLIASASGDSWTGWDPALYQQALRQGELDEFHLRVRQHSDGRTLVYGVVKIRHGGAGWRGGKLLEGQPLGSTIATAIRRVGEEAGMPDYVARECIEDLPPEEL